MLNCLNYKYLLCVALIFVSCKGKGDKQMIEDTLNESIKPLSSVKLESKLNENSGAIFWNDTLWLQNDSSEPVLYGVDPTTGKIVKEHKIPGLKMLDWESLAQDEHYIYIGDFGNNSNYRKNLRIFRIAKDALLAGQAELDTIRFFYEDQVDYTYNETFDTDYDCESMIIIEDSIYLFTKQWISKGTTVYTIPKAPGDHRAEKVDAYNIDLLITEAYKFSGENTIILTGYNELLNPTFVLLEGYSADQFFSGEVIKIQLGMWTSQIEAICLKEGYRCYVSSEGFWGMSPQLHVFDFKNYIEAARLLQAGEDGN
ncbi:hypothetical protein [Carboxylicivirga sp. RSCT41]|uniref:hypothetical protein n=1 Tax=Carboxylicivirga agarovorans TaxID=3417570 RepID=UPI003D35711C